MTGLVDALDPLVKDPLFFDKQSVSAIPARRSPVDGSKRQAACFSTRSFEDTKPHWLAVHALIPVDSGNFELIGDTYCVDQHIV
jgi:hypothetical protein